MAPHKRSTEPNEFGGEWSLQKLNCVEDYLRAYLSVFFNLSWAKLWYIDAFSGDGVQRLPQVSCLNQDTSLFSVRDVQFREFVEGSAARALRVTVEKEEIGKRGFDYFAFLELEQEKLDSLREMVARQYPTQLHKCRFICGDVNEKLPPLLHGIDWSKNRAVSFIDPFATQFRWEAMEAFRGTCSDVWLLFPVGGILRMMPRSRPPDRGLAASLDSIFGDQSWRKAYHEPAAVQPDLYGIVHVELERDTGAEGLLRYYKNRLETVFPGVLDPVELRTSTNAPLFALFSLVANNSDSAIRASQRIAKHLLSKMR